MIECLAFNRRVGFDYHSQQMASSNFYYSSNDTIADALRMLQRRCPKSGPFTITGHLFQLCNKDWCLAFSKVARRNNGVADVLAKLASDASFDVMIFYESSIGMEAD
ncbi:hypothetical protein V6N13_135017 [Hibiscus sabdariffa]